MSKKRSPYPYSLDESLGMASRQKKKRHPLLPLLWLLALVAAVGVVLTFIVSPSLDSVVGFLPFPKELKAIRMQHNGQEVILLPDSQVVVNPRDTLQLLEVKTDGWVTWGTRVSSAEVDVAALQRQPVAIKDLLPNETFETPKNIDLRVLLWNRPIGRISFLVQLDGKDWLHKASAAGDTDHKIAFLEKALQENSSNVLVKTQLAALYFDVKRYEDAGRLYREINEAGATRAIYEKLLAVYQAQNKVDDALVTYLDILKLDDQPETFKEFMAYLQKRKSKEDAGRFLEKHQQEIPRAYHSSVLLQLAELNTQTKNWSKAASSYEKAIQAGVKDPDVYYNLAVTYQQNDDPDKAIQALSRYLQKNSGDVKSWMQLAEMQEKKGATAQARETYETVLQKSPQNKEALVRLVALLEKSNDKAALQAAYEKLAQQQPKNRTVLYNLAVLYYEGKKWDKAEEAFEGIAAMDPKDLESRKYLLDLYRKQKKDKQEFEMIQTLSEMDPKNQAYHEALFNAFDQKKDYKTMTAVFKKASQQQPDSVTLHNYLLYAALNQKDNKAALVELEQLIRLQPKEKKHLRQAANLYESTGNTAEALKKVGQILKLDPKDKEAKDDYLRLKMMALTTKKPAQ